MCLYHTSAQLCLNGKRLRYTVLQKPFRFVGVLNRFHNKRDCAIFNGTFCVVASVQIDEEVSLTISFTKVRHFEVKVSLGYLEQIMLSKKLV